jgi:hypothetical protein
MPRTTVVKCVDRRIRQHQITYNGLLVGCVELFNGRFAPIIYCRSDAMLFRKMKSDEFVRSFEVGFDSNGVKRGRLQHGVIFS